MSPGIAFAEGYYFHQDHLGGSSVVTNEEGEIVAEYEYYPYGEEYSTVESDFGTDYKFTGQEEDEETGLYYYGARYYNPEVGRFMGQDPAVYDERVFDMLRNPQMFNSYSYVLNNPIKYTDPSGEEAYEVTGYYTMVLNTTVNDASYLQDCGFFSKAWQFKNKIGDGMKWDMKGGTFQGIDNTVDSMIIGGQEYSKDTMANLLYGYVGSSIGFSEDVLLFFAGANEVISGDAHLEDWATNFDHSLDQAAINLGIQLYEQYGLDGVTEAELTAILQDSGLSLDESRSNWGDVCYNNNDDK